MLRNRGNRIWGDQTVLRVLHNLVNVGKISHGDELYDGKDSSIIENELFTRAIAGAIADVAGIEPASKPQFVPTPNYASPKGF